ncbi:hypothetical protein MKZ20_02855 [Psychrobacillus sp. FSL K6-2684]|uniref:hypothetical protein n=1 Tax=Psychrobacillus sp. FSL K6-2684 TaxID=2921547 RepID=UPI0030F66668
MNIIINKSQTGNYNTDLYNLLNNIPDNILYNQEHRLRPPLGIYSVSTIRVFNAFEKVLALLKNKDSKIDEIATEHGELLDSLMAYIDDGYLMIKCFFPASSVKKNIPFAHNWLKAVDNNVKEIIEDYQKDIFEHRDILAKIVNKIKHNHARYCHIEASTIFGKIRGFYIEGVNEKGVIIPELDIHPIYNNIYTSISYNKDIKERLVDFYIISKLLENVIHRIVKTKYNITLTPTQCNYAQDDKVLKILKDCESLPNLYFSDEYEKEIPQIKVDSNSNVIELRSSAYKSFKNKFVRPTSYKIRTIMTADGVSNSWALPYFGK